MDIVQLNVTNLDENLLQPKGKSKKSISLLPANVSLLIVSKLPPSKKSIRLSLPHGCSTDSSICFIVKDVYKTDFNKSTTSWKLRWKTDLSKLSPAEQMKSGMSTIPTFLPLRELKLSYQAFAAKSRLAASFDVFLADKRIIHHLPSKLGKAFYGGHRGKIPIPVDVVRGNIVDIAQKQSSSVIFQIRGLGTSESIPIGTLQLSLSQLKENILYVCEKLIPSWPDGGLDNIRSIYVQLYGRNIPLYFDLAEPSETVTLDRIITVNDSNANHEQSSTTKHRRQLTLDMLHRVSEDLPLPEGGLESVMKKLDRRPRTKRIGMNKISKNVTKKKRVA